MFVIWFNSSYLFNLYLCDYICMHSIFNKKQKTSDNPTSFWPFFDPLYPAKPSCSFIFDHCTISAYKYCIVILGRVLPECLQDTKCEEVECFSKKNGNEGRCFLFFVGYYIIYIQSHMCRLKKYWEINQITNTTYEKRKTIICIWYVLF